MRRLSSDELDELVRLHLRVSNHLVTARGMAHDEDLTAYLSMVVARSSALVHGTRPRSLRTLLDALMVSFPAAVWHARIGIVVSAALFVVGALSVGAWLTFSESALQASAPADVRQAYVEREFVEYYSSEPAVTFAARVFTNNAGVGALAWGSGVLFGVPTLAILLLNGVNVGLAGGLFHAVGDAGTFWGLILPHGLLELTAVFVAGGAGLRLGWSVIAPGDRTRRASLRDEGRRSIVIVGGLVVVFLIAGVLEAFVTPAPWPTSLRVGTGAAVWVALSTWVIATGRSLAARGLTGAPNELPLLRSAPPHQPPDVFVSR